MDSGNSETTTKTEPWGAVKEYLKGGYRDAQSIYNQGAPGYYPGQTVAPMSGFTKGSLDSMAQRGADGSPLINAAQGQLTNTLNGSYLEQGNPHLQNAIGAATRPVMQAYNDQIMPGLDSNFSSAGRYGSGAHAMASADAGGQMMDQVGDISSQMTYQNYGDERQRQIQGMLFAPELAAQDYKDIGMLGQAGAGYDRHNQNVINADVQKYNYDQNSDWNFLSDYMGMLNGAPGGSTTVTQPQQGANPFTGALGGAMTGASIGSAMAPIGATGLAALGGPLPLMAGAGIGLLGSIFG